MEVARWVIEKDLALTAADTWAVEVVPNPDKSLAFPVHAELQTKHRILNHENLVFDELVADKKYQFVYIFAPAPIKGATGSNGAPIAVMCERELSAVGSQLSALRRCPIPPPLAGETIGALARISMQENGGEGCGVGARARRCDQVGRRPFEVVPFPGGWRPRGGD
jgi:hypothetical protein